MVVFYITRGGELIQAARAEKLLNLPSQVETVSKLGFLVSSWANMHDLISNFWWKQLGVQQLGVDVFSIVLDPRLHY